MKDIGVRVARQKLLRYRVPTPSHVRWTRLMLLGALVWAVWALLLSDHSVGHLLQLKSQRDRLSRQLVAAKAEVVRAEREMPRDKPTNAEAERILRVRHTFARDGELIYIIGEDSTKAHR